mgnify:CR=1 FL=1
MLLMAYQVYSKGVSAKTETPLSIYKKFVGQKKGFLLERKQEEKNYSIIGIPTTTIYWKDGLYQESLEGKKEKIGETLFDLEDYMKPFMVEDQEAIFAGGLVGNVSYDVIHQYICVPKIKQGTLQLPDIHLLDVREWMVYHHEEQKIQIGVLEEKNKEGQERAESKIRAMLEILESHESDTKAELNMTIGQKRGIYSNHDMQKKGKVIQHIEKEKMIQQIQKAQSYIQKGDITQVVLSMRWSIEAEVDGLRLYQQLREINPSPYLFYIQFENYTVIGSSPEMLVQLKGDTITHCPIAGTSKRGENPGEDQKLVEQLQQDPKEIKEHLMLLELGKNDMSKVSLPGSIQIPKKMEIKKYSHVMHIESMIQGKRNPRKGMFHILSTFLPAGTLSGSPRIRAIEIIEELEEEKREHYGGGIGYFGYQGNMDIAIAIRMMIQQRNKIYLQAGAGIVSDSIPEKEYEECYNKLLATLTAVSQEVDLEEVKGGMDIERRGKKITELKIGKETERIKIAKKSETAQQDRKEQFIRRKIGGANQMEKIMGKLLDGSDLSYGEAEEAMERMMEGDIQPTQVAAFLTAMRMKGEKPHELSACAKVMRKKANRINTYVSTLDTCGTGGDNANTINISTGVGFVCAAAGIPVAKHGNRSVSSKSGSADVLEALGAQIGHQQNQAEQLLQDHQFTFLYAPNYHPAMKNVGGVRKELGYRTLLNLLGPLANPAASTYQLLGVYDIRLSDIFAEILKDLGVARALIVHGMDGLDEITTTTATHVTELQEGKIRNYYLHPAEFGIDVTQKYQLQGGEAKENATILRSVFQGEKSPYLDIIALNSGAAFYTYGLVPSIKKGVEEAYQLLYSKEVYKKVEDYIAATQEVLQ